MTQPPDIPPDKILEQFQEIFGDLFGSREGSAGRGADVRVPLTITVAEAASGAERTVEVPRWRPCIMCRGHGGMPGGEVSSCGACGGSGLLARHEGPLRVTTPCSTCRGRRRVFSRPCSVCEGSGGRDERASLKIRVPPGVTTGQKLRLQGQGRPALAPFGSDASQTDPGPAGDLYVELVVDGDARPSSADDREALLARELAATPPASRGTIPAEARVVAGIVVGLALCLGYWLLSSR